MQAAVEAGVDPAGPKAQQLAAEWMALLEQFHGGTEGLRDSLYRMQAANAQQSNSNTAAPRLPSTSSKWPTPPGRDGAWWWTARHCASTTRRVASRIEDAAEPECCLLAGTATGKMDA